MDEREEVVSDDLTYIDQMVAMGELRDAKLEALAREGASADLDQPAKPAPLVIPDAEIEWMVNKYCGPSHEVSVQTVLEMRADLDRIIAARVPKEDGK